jgi:hypothetical protein
MKIPHILAFMAGAAAVFAGVTCAPIDDPDSEQMKAATAPKPTAPHHLPDSTASQPDALKARIDAAIKQVQQRDLLTTNGFWTVFHGILGLGPSMQMRNPTTGERVTALDYIASGGEVRGLRFLVTPSGLDVETRPGTFIAQGHQDQFVAEMVQWGLSPDRKIVVDGKDYTFMDCIRHSKARASVKQKQELEWAIVIIGQHFGTDGTWTNASGETVSFEDLLRHELDAPMDQAACGGTHRLFGLSWVNHLHQQRGGQTEGIWRDVANRIAQYKMTARQLQNPDGSFSTNFFRGRGNSPDMQLRVNTTGHILEWLALSGTDYELQAQWMRDAANALSLMILDMKDDSMEGGGLYHAVHGLLIYSSRVYGPKDLGPNAPPVPLPPKEN